MNTLYFHSGETENNVINLYPNITDQLFEGFGGAMTEATASTYALLNDLQKRELLTAYFSPDRMNYQFLRIHVDSCDFCLEPYCGYTVSGAPDFSRMEQYILPMLQDAETIAKRKLPIMLSPWSPPAFMKTNGIRQQGGKLKPKFYGAYADYLCRYAKHLRDLGFSVTRMSIQNEAKAVQTWDSCIFSAEEEKTFLRDYLYPTMAQYGLTDLELYIWDHNKERAYERMRDVIDETTDPMVTGLCFHWYSGDHFEALDYCRRQFPDKKLLLSESCIEYRFYDRNDVLGSSQKLSHELIGDLNHGISAFFDWNLLLDETGGPNYAGNFCLAAFHFDRQAKDLQPTLLQTYYETFARAVQPGSVRIATTRYTDEVDATAWCRLDGTIALVLLNRSSFEKTIVVRLDNREANVTLAPFDLHSYLI